MLLFPRCPATLFSGYTMNGEVNSALLKLGHFTRIVGLQQDK
jgi:hypothetical protein